VEHDDLETKIREIHLEIKRNFQPTFGKIFVNSPFCSRHKTF
jgi:hypothetical protein